MAENSKIEWCDHTFNPWRGCTKVSPGCAHCYAETLSHRNPAVLGEWGPGRPRIKAAPAMWRQPLKWNREAAAKQKELEARRSAIGASRGPEWEIVRRRVFCASLADWLDDEVPIEWLADLLALIHQTPNLDWLLLTKRPQNWKSRLLAVYEHTQDSRLAVFVNAWGARGEAPANVWLGTSVEDQQRAEERIPHLLEIPARVRFLSCEPLLGPVDVAKWLRPRQLPNADGYGGDHAPGWTTDFNTIHWVIAGGESGSRARPIHPDWARSLRDQCADAGVPFLFKQWGEWVLAVEEHGIGGSIMPENGVIPCGIPAEWVGMDGKMAVGSWHGLLDPVAMARVGKKLAGRTLDGVIHHEFPQSEPAAL